VGRDETLKSRFWEVVSRIRVITSWLVRYKRVSLRMSVARPAAARAANATTAHARLNAVLTAGVARTDAIVAKRPESLAEPMSVDGFEYELASHAAAAMRHVSAELARDLVGLSSAGYAQNEIKLQLAESEFIEHFGVLSSVMRVSRSSMGVYEFSILASIDRGAPGVASQHYKSTFDFRPVLMGMRELELVYQNAREAFRNSENGLQYRDNVHRAILDFLADHKEVKQLFETISGQLIGTLRIPIGPNTTLDHFLNTIIGPNPNFEFSDKGYEFTACLIEAEKAYLTTLLMMAYQPDQVLSIMNLYGAMHLLERFS